jgi:hypothetical protein
MLFSDDPDSHNPQHVDLLLSHAPLLVALHFHGGQQILQHVEHLDKDLSVALCNPQGAPPEVTQQEFHHLFIYYPA